MKREDVKKALDEIEKQAENYDPIRAAAQDYFDLTEMLMKMPQKEFEMYVEHFLKPLEPEWYGVGSRGVSGSSARYGGGNGRGR